MHERLSILEMVEQGRISVDEAVSRLTTLDDDHGSPGAEHQPRTEAEERREKPKAVSRPVSDHVVAVIWRSVLGAGIAFIVAGGLLLARFYGGEASWGLGWGWVLFGMGVLAMLLAWWLRRAKWLAIHVREGDGGAFNLALPLPIGLALWALRLGGRCLPKLGRSEAEELASAIREELADRDTFSVQVEEGEDGDSVELTIG